MRIFQQLKTALLNRSSTGSQRGFTLLELLVVISIIAILIGLVSVSFTTAQQKSRDARRRGDMKAIQSALEQYYAVNDGSYPTSGYGDIDQLPGGLPVDPRNSGLNVYSVSGDADSYCACALLETDSGNSTTNACVFGDGDYFCVANQQ